MGTKEWGDLHCHSTMKPFHSALSEVKRKTMGMFFETSNSCDALSGVTMKLLPTSEKYSQACLSECRKGNVSLLFNALYPIEIEWFDLMFPIPLLINENNAFCCMANFDAEVMNDWFLSIIKDKKSKPLPYFDRLCDEYYYLRSVEAQSITEPFVVIKSFAEYQNIKQKPLNDRPTMIVNTIEGAHSLFNLPNYAYIKKITTEVVNDPKLPLHLDLLAQCIKNITTIKSWQHPPVFITLAHHFWNFLAGHAESIGSCVIDQKQGLDTGISLLGMHAIRLLLDAKQGPRILIDIKHLSPKSRTDYYRLLDAEFPNTPLVASHAAVAGRISADDECESVAQQVFQTGEINLFDPDLVRIVSSKGLIGIMMEEGRLLNKDLMKTILQLHSKIKNKAEADQFLLQRMAEIVLAQVLYIADKAGPSAWDCVCIGSDFDGMINSLDTFTDVRKIPSLFDEMERLLNNNTPILKGLTTFTVKRIPHDCLYTSAQVMAMKQNFSAAELVQKMRIGNLERFLQLVM